MLLSADIISFELSKKFSLKKQCDNNIMQFNPPLLLSPGTIACFDSSCSSTDASIKLSNSKNTLLVYCNGEKIPPIKNNLYEIYLDQFSNAEEVLNYLQCVFASYDTWDRQLQLIALEDRNVQELLDICVPIMQNDIGLLDGKLTLQAVAYYDSPPGQPTWEKQKQISRVMQEIREVRDYKTPFHYVHTKEDPGLPTIGVNLFDGQMWIGLFFLEGVHPFRKHDLTLMAHAAKYLKYILFQPSHGNGAKFNRVADVFRDMIDKKHVEQSELIQIWSLVGFDLDDQFQCMSVELPPDLLPEIRRYICSQLAFQAPSTISVEYGGRIAMLINMTKATIRQPDYLVGIRNLLNDLHIHAGISGICNDVFMIRNYYASAEAALYLGLNACDPETIYEFSRYSREYALYHCPGDLKPSMLYPEGLVRLIQHDENSSVSYVETLKVYLEEGCNAAKASRRLFIERNSFLGRLEYVLKLLDMDISNPEIRQYLILCIYLYKANVHRDSV